jgi:Ca2+-binding EF-hand superfamily protein
MMTSGEVVSFAAPTGELAAEWIKVHCFTLLFSSAYSFLSFTSTKKLLKAPHARCHLFFLRCDASFGLILILSVVAVAALIKTIKDAALAEEDSFGALSPTSGSSSPISSNKSLPPSTAASSKSGTSASEEPVSLLTALTPEPDSPEVAHWKEAYAAATSSAGVTELDEAAFLALVRSEMPADEGANQPMVDDLKGAFAVADADRSGKVDGPEFVRLMQLVADGEVHGLSSAVFFQKAGRDAKFKSELAAAKARDARNVAALEAAKAAAVVEEARMAEAKASEAKRSSEAVLPATEAEKAETKWRAMFHAALKEGAVDLDRAEFVVLVKKAMVREVMMANEGVRAESGNRVAMPLDADLEAAFAVADTDQNGAYC